MDARLLKAAILVSTFTSLGATYKTPNFVVHAPTAEAAEQVGRAAEHFRSELAVAWLGKELPQWYQPCPIDVKMGQIGAGGATTFSFDRGEVFGWKMRVQGSLERILDSVIPHEVSHTIFACYFRRPLPRWADEGAATLIEHSSEQRRQQLMLKQVWDTRRRYPLRQLLSITEYPQDMQNVMTLYAQGYSLADFLVQAGGRPRYLKFLNDANQNGWDKSLKQNYDVATVEELEERWTGWVIAGSPRIDLPEGQQLAADESHRPDAPVIRSQSPDPRRPRNTARAASASDRRGEGLTAPRPAANSAKPAGIVEPAAKEKPFTAAQLTAINDGWMPITTPRPSRPAPLAARMPRPRSSPSGDERSVEVRLPK